MKTDLEKMVNELYIAHTKLEEIEAIAEDLATQLDELEEDLSMDYHHYEFTRKIPFEERLFNLLPNYQFIQDSGDNWILLKEL